MIDQKKKIEFPSTISVSKECLSLIDSLLQQDPLKRMSWEEFFIHPWLNLRGSIPDPLALDTSFPHTISLKSLSNTDPSQANVLASSFASLPQPKKLNSEVSPSAAKTARSRSYSLNTEQPIPRVPLGYAMGSPPNNPTNVTGSPNNLPQKYRAPSYTELPVPVTVGQSGIPIPKVRTVTRSLLNCRPALLKIQSRPILHPCPTNSTLLRQYLLQLP
jgi:hypothetical protein